jgi:hypothetical protein
MLQGWPRGSLRQCGGGRGCRRESGLAAAATRACLGKGALECNVRYVALKSKVNTECTARLVASCRGWLAPEVASDLYVITMQ